LEEDTDTGLPFPLTTLEEMSEKELKKNIATTAPNAAQTSPYIRNRRGEHDMLAFLPVDLIAVVRFFSVSAPRCIANAKPYSGCGEGDRM